MKAMRHVGTRCRQQGTAIFTVLIATIGLLVLLGAYMVNQKPSTTTQMASKGADLTASALLQSAAAIRDGVAQMIAAQNLSASQIYISTTAGSIANASPGAAGNTIKAGSGSNAPSWLYDSTNGIPVQDISPDAMANASGNASGWIIKTSADDATPAGGGVVKLKGIGADASPDLLAVAYDLKLAVCQSFNKAANAAAPGATPVASGVALAAWQTPGTAVDLSAGIAGIDGRSQGCVGTTDGKYVAYVVLQAS